ncbi:MAG: hypothetical protein P1P63_01885 [Treponemataceae bacterium]
MDDDFRKTVEKIVKDALCYDDESTKSRFNELWASFSEKIEREATVQLGYKLNGRFVPITPPEKLTGEQKQEPEVVKHGGYTFTMGELKKQGKNKTGELYAEISLKID